jgi:hypothetical protein
LRERAGEIEELGIATLVVTFERPDIASAYVEETALPWPLVLDPARRLYQAFGMARGDRWAIWGPASWGIYLSLLRRGRRLRPPTGDIYQLGGDVLIEPGGLVAYHRVGEGPADRPEIDELLGIVRGGRGR